MKKLLSVLLTLSMLLTLLIVPISAGGTEPENSDEFTPVDLGTAAIPNNTTTEDGVEYYTDANSVKYIVIRDADDFKAMTGNANYILASDIDLGGLKMTTQSSGVVSTWESGIFDGNGKTIFNYEVAGNATGLFWFAKENVTVTIKNTTFGKDSAKVTGGGTGNGGNAAVVGKFQKAVTMNFINCVAYVDFESVKAGNAAFVGMVQIANMSINFTDCKAYGEISGYNKTGAFIANNDKTGNTFSFTNCENHVDVSGTTQVGGFIGFSGKASTTITFTGCKNFGNVSASTAGTQVGGFVGSMINGASATFTNCENTGTLTATDSFVGSFAGQVASSGDFTISSTDTDFNYNGLIGNYPYYTKTSRGNEYYSATINGLQTLAAAKAAYFQTATGSAEGLQNVRILLALPESEIANIKNIEFKVVFKNLNVTEGATTKTLTVTDADAAIASYYSVIADTKIAEAPEGYVMVAVVVTDVDTSVWTASGANLEVYMTSAGGTNTIYNNTPEAENKNP